FSLRSEAQREESYSEVGNTGGTYPFTKIHLKGEQPTRSAVRTSSPLRSLRPCWTTFLSILLGVFLFPGCTDQVNSGMSTEFLPQPASRYGQFLSPRIDSSPLSPVR